MSLSTTAAQANANITLSLNVPLNDYLLSLVADGTPAAAFVAPGPGNPGFVVGTHPAPGDAIGTMSRIETLGVTGNPCNLLSVYPEFTFLNATVDNSAANIIDAVPQDKTNTGSGSTLDNMWSDDGASTTGPDAQTPWDLPWGDGVGHGAGSALTPAERTNGLPAQVDRYPSYLNILFDPDYSPGPDATYGTGDDVAGPAAPVQPLARYAGGTNVVGTSRMLNLVIFAPGALSSAFAAPHPFADLSSTGYTSIAVADNPTSDIAHGSVSDLCTPYTATTNLLGLSRVNPCNGAAGPPCDTPQGISHPYGYPALPTILAAPVNKARYNNPPSGTYSWISQYQSLRDADGDGIENFLDPCPLDEEPPAAAYNPRTDTGPDADNDGLPDVCDPNDGDGDFDHDGDGWENSYDNCPLVSNAPQRDSEVDIAYAITMGHFPALRGDGIGDACDISNDTADMGDGYSDSAESGTPLCGNGQNDDDKVGAGLVADDAVIDDGCPGGPAQVGAFSEAQFNIGTDPDLRCGVGNEGLGVPSGAWPSDLYSAGTPPSTDKINVLDLTSFIAPTETRKLDTTPGQANFNSRWDLSPGRGVFNNMINVTDLTALIAGSSGYPPMLGGARALSGPVGTDPSASATSNGAVLTTTSTTNITIVP